MNPRALALDELDRLLDQSRSAQEARLAELRGTDPELAAVVERLLEADRKEDTLVDAGFDELVGRVAQDFDTPDELGPYRIIREIGRGGMGVVYEAEQLRPRRLVALKTLPTLGVTADARARFEVEVQALADVQHPGIPQVYELFEHDGRPIVSMELVRGQPLDEALEAATPTRRAAVLARVAEAVAFVNDRGVVHRDLKPANILVGEDDQPKVLDFGIAALGGGSTSAEGTPRYMAPEQRAGQPQDARVDVYALGVIARELLHDSRLRPRDLQALLDRATAAEPAHRTPSAALLAEELHRWRTLQPLRSVPTPLGRRLTLMLRRAPLTVFLSGLAGLTALAGVGVVVGSALSAWDARRLAELEHQAAERSAADRLAALQQWEAEAGPSAPSLVQTFERLVDDPALEGTAALSDAWSWWASKEPDKRLRPASYGQAWVHATTGPQERQARVALALAAWEAGKWDALAYLTSGIEEELPGEAVRAAAFWEGDHEAIRRSLPDNAAPLLGLLDEARREPRTWHARWVSGPHWIRAERGVLHVGDPLGAETETVELPDGKVQLWELDDAVGVQVGRRFARFVPGTGQSQLDFTPGAKPDPTVSGHLVDGTRFEVTASPEGLDIVFPDGGRSALRLGPDRVGRAHFSEPQVIDVDGDGSHEILLPAHGWHDTGLQVWDIEEDPPRLVGHRPEVPYRVRTLSTDPPRVFVSEAEPGTTPRSSRPDLAPPRRSVRVLRWVGDGWEEELDLFDRARISGIQLGDLDGDGVDDLVVAAQDVTLIYRGLGGIDFSEPLVIPSARSPLLVQADADPALELWLRGEGTGDLLLGVAGVGPLPPPPQPEAPALRPVPTEASADVRRRWERVSELVRIRFTHEATRSLRDLGRDPGPAGIAALRWALELSTRRPGTQRVLAHELRRHPAATDAEQRLATDTLRAAVHDVDGPARTWRGPAWPFEVLDEVAVRAELDGSVELYLDANAPPLLELPVRPTEGPVRLALEVDPTTTDFGAGLRLALFADEHAAELEIQRVGGGAPSNHRLAVRCGLRGAGPQRMAQLPTTTTRMELSWDPDSQTVVCRVGDTWLRRPADLGDPDRLRFQLQARPSRFGPLTRMGLRLLRADLHGAEPTTAQPFHAAPASASEASRSASAMRAAVSLGRAGTPARARLAPLSETELARLLREDPDLWLPVVRTQRPEAWARALAHALDGPERVDDPMVAHVLRIDLLLGLDGADQTERRLLVMGASTLWRRGDGVKALTVLERIPPELDDPQVWSLRARLHATAGEDARAREAIARWRATARPAFDVDAMLEADPALSRLIEAP